MTRESCDVAIVGAGFAGTVMALVLHRAGLRPVLIERGSHPRFAIGESSTPLANLALEELGRAYDLPQLTDLSEWGRWQRSYPQLACGLKRGFSYFRHEPGRPFQADRDHRNELLVAASPRDEVADTHWFREHVDHFFVEQAMAAGVPYFDHTEITELEHSDGWRLHGRRGERSIQVSARFLIDASGPAGFLPRRLGIDTRPHGLHTNCWSVYTHFEAVALWQDVLSECGADLSDHPFPCDAAALHHILDEGWIWVLRFNNGVTSAGIAFDGERRGPDGSRWPEEQWQAILERYPSLARQFRDARPIQPWVRTGRLQHLAARFVGPDWALLPHACYFLDPFFSGGNAHSLHGIQRLAGILAKHLGRTTLAGQLRSYEDTLREEIQLLDTLVHGSYLTFGRFELFASFALYYFAAAITCETLRRQGQAHAQRGFLLADNPAFRAKLARTHSLLLDGAPGVEAMRQLVAEDLAPLNLPALMYPVKRNMVPF